MKKTELFFALILGLTACTQTKYFVKSEQDLSQIDISQSGLNFIPLTDEDLQNSTILNTAYTIIVSKNRSKLGNYLSSVQSETPDFYLAKTLYHISRTEYQEAAVSLKLIDENHYTLIRDLLFIDLNYELAKHNGQRNFLKFLQDYQTLADKYPDDDLLRKIIALRIRYVKYNH